MDPPCPGLLSDLLDDPHLDIQERTAPRHDVVLLPQAVELKVDCVQPGLRDLLEEALLDCEPDAVRRDLDLGEPHLLGRLHDLRELGVDRRLSASELDRGHGDGALGPEDRELVHDLLEGRLEYVSGRVRVREANRALQVASVREVDVAEGCGGVVEVAETALIGTHLRVDDGWVVDPNAVEGPVLRPQVHLRIGPTDLVELAMLPARLLHLERAVADVQGRGNDLETFRAQGSRSAGKSLLELRGHRHDRVVLSRFPVHVPDRADRVVRAA